MLSRNLLTGLTAAALLGATASAGFGASMLTFDSGNTFDGYPGGTGGGWQGAWSLWNGSTSNTNAPLVAVENTSPLTAGGNNYLKLTSPTSLTNPSQYETAVKGMSRQMAVTSGTDDFEQLHTVSFDVRVGSNPAFDFTIADNTSNQSTSTSSGFIIRSTTAGHWGIYNGGRNAAGYNASLLIDTGVAISASSTYHFDVRVDPSAGYYDVSIDGVDYDPAPGTEMFGFRSNAFSNKSWVGFFGTATASTAASFSVDNLAVSVPEPASVAALGLTGLLALRRRVRA